MSSNESKRTNDRASDVDPGKPAATRDQLTLEAVVVRYEDGPDRCTIAPRDCPDEAKLTTWLSADVATVVDLEDAR